MVPYVLDHDACPLLLISRLAEHTKNLAGDARVSLLIHESGENVQAQARVTLLGQAARIDNPEQVFEARYERYFPATRGYRAQLDFEIWRIAPVTLRAIAGFAKVHWVSREAYAPPANTLADDEAGILDHMNSDHAHTLRDFVGLPLLGVVTLVANESLRTREKSDLRRFVFASSGLIGVFITGIVVLAFLSGRLG